MPSLTEQEVEAIVRRVLDRQPRGGMLALVAGGVGVQAVGRATLTWAGGTQYATGQDVPHGLGRMPIAVVATCDQKNTDAEANVRLDLSNGSTFRLSAFNSPGSPAGGTTDAVSWFAVG